MDEERVQRAFEQRLAVYQHKLGKADALADDDRNRWDALKYVVEAIEILAVEAGIKVGTHVINEDEWELPAQGIEASGEDALAASSRSDESPVVVTSDDAPNT